MVGDVMVGDVTPGIPRTVVGALLGTAVAAGLRTRTSVDSTRDTIIVFLRGFCPSENNRCFLACGLFKL